MVRQLYIFLLALHPAQFRYRFALEMLAIYDEASVHGGRFRLFADGIRSLVRQWAHPYRPAATPVPVGAGMPMFGSLDASLPNRRHLVMGATFSLLLFSLLTIGIGRGGRSPGILIGSIFSRPGIFDVARGSIIPSALTTEVTALAPQARAASESVPSSFGILDRNRDWMLSSTEIRETPFILRVLDVDRDGRLDLGEMYPFLAVFDRDGNRVISRAEMDISKYVLWALDANDDGVLTTEEAVTAVPAANGH